MDWGMRSNDVTANGLADVVGLPMLSSQCNHNTKHGQEPNTRPHVVHHSRMMFFCLL